MTREVMPIGVPAVAAEVERWVTDAHADVERASNVSLLDSGQVYSLHILATSIYTQGLDAGMRSENARHRGERDREFNQRADERGAARQLELARKALVATGYFGNAEPLDVASRIAEYDTDIVGPLLLLTAILANDVYNDGGLDAELTKAGANGTVIGMIAEARAALNARNTEL